MYDDMWIHRIPLEEFVPKYFKVTDSVLDALHNIAYTNMRCLNASYYIRKHVGKTEQYEVGDTLICRVYKNLGTQRFNVNYRYRIIIMTLPRVTLENVKSKEQFTIDRYTLDKHFRYDCCTTCHSAQGASIDGQIIILEWDKKHPVTREWIWCALTRSTDFSKVRFFKSVINQNALNEEASTKYITTKIKNYQIQDENANREIDVDKYVNHEWFMKRLTNTCCNCGCLSLRSKTEMKRVT